MCGSGDRKAIHAPKSIRIQKFSAAKIAKPKPTVEARAIAPRVFFSPGRHESNPYFLVKLVPRISYDGTEMTQSVGLVRNRFGVAPWSSNRLAVAPCSWWRKTKPPRTWFSGPVAICQVRPCPPYLISKTRMQSSRRKHSLFLIIFYKPTNPFLKYVLDSELRMKAKASDNS